ncbi:MAG: hypothetical protein KDA78_01300, partial [Planctomycetaceae bacterium]|nr:hypothetical protein [Planctomycetaceae bacterium]
MTQLREPIPYKLIVGLFSAAAAIYCISVIYYVSTSADLGIRCLVNKEQPESSGILIRQFELPADHLTRLLPSSFGPAPVAGDHLLELNDQPIHSFASFSKALAGLRSALSEDGSFDSRVEEANPLDIDRYASLPGVIKYSSLERQNPEQEENTSESRTKRAEARYVRVKYRSASTGAEELCWLMLRPQSTLEIVLSIIWSLLEFSVLALAALAYSTRPNDHAARVFYLLSLLTIPAFVGGYHWWVISANPLLTFPFAISAILVPVVTLHFFLSYPRRHPILKQNGSGRLLLIYLPPAIMITLVSILLSIGYLRFNPQVPLQSDDLLMTSLRYSIDIYIMISVVYYGISMAVMFANMRANLQTAEQMQMRWIIGAACLALPLVLYTVYLAYADRVGMALGRGRIPMIIVSLLFLGAYAIGIIRYRLMLIDQILSRRMLYLCTSQLITLAYSLLIAAGALWTVYRGISI